MLLTNMIDNNKMLKMIQGQGHKIEGQGQICNFVKTKFDHKTMVIGS